MFAFANIPQYWNGAVGITSCLKDKDSFKPSYPIPWFLMTDTPFIDMDYL